MGCVQAVFYTFKKSFGEISPNSNKSYQVSHHNRYFLLQFGNFIEVLIKGNNLLWYKSIITGHFKMFLGTKS